MGAKLEESDLVIMVGSFYHFHDHIQDLLTTIFQSSKYFLLVEPVRNLSGKNGIVTKLLAIAADPGTGNIAFRYEALDLIEELNGLSPLIGFDVERLVRFSWGINVLMRLDKKLDLNRLKHSRVFK